jgi:hypothetical protein
MEFDIKALKNLLDIDDFCIIAADTHLQRRNHAFDTPEPVRWITAHGMLPPFPLLAGAPPGDCSRLTRFITPLPTI